MPIPLSAMFADENFYRHLDIERRFAHKNQELLDAIDKELCAIAFQAAQDKKQRIENGEQAALKVKEILADRNRQIKNKARHLRESGTQKHAIAGILAPLFHKTPGQIRRILKAQK